MGKALVIVVGVAIFVYALFDLIATPARNTRFIPKPLWFVALLIVPLGPLLWIFWGQKSSPPGPSAPPPRRRPTALGPDDDPDYLRGL
ncbi:PLDc N-terminal domain-containing protein [Aeromicrobium sp.]